MQQGTNQGKFDWVILFYYPTNAKNSVGEVITSMNATTRKIRAERIFKSSTERMEAMQQVGNTSLSFRMADVRKSGLDIKQTWQFDAYQISNVSDVKRFKVSGLQDEGRRNFIVVTGEHKDNG